jgi:SAM-dependent methyltransferase
MSNAFWEERYSAAAASGEAVWSLTPNEWIEAVVGPLQPGTAVDLATGEGRNALWLASRGWSVTAVDFSPAGLAIGRARAAESGLDVDWVEADATTWVASTPVDLVVVAYLQLPAAPLAAAIANATASLAPGGTLALIGHDRDNLVRGVGGPQDAERLNDVGELRSAASALDVIECRQYERTTADGRVAIDAILLARKPA